MIKLAVVTGVAAVFFFTACSGASPSGEVPDSTQGPSSPAPSASLAAGSATGASADTGGASTPSSAPPGAAPAAPPAAAPAPAPGNGCQLEVEPNDTRAQAQRIALVDAASATACGALGKATDEDWFVVHVTGGSFADLTVAMTTTDAVTLQVIAPNGETYEESHGLGANGHQADAIDAWNGAGDYVIHVASATHAQVSYSLAFTVEQ